ncbi:hypothetical protein B4U79_00525 [Dinothrombium tinctorium]|uniref:CAF17 C-terminal domain-containing protein n=1 Tax=Dinothrombium tinctorium TaxID=1965070 RepID=A0A3S4QY21_9ACAR|nr:hypothetical protein B4U79_07642 [Dinothrombium tinctorium]RWS09876.1 hypothetical protein B4U79_11320 [Dinothrombium tinctorium]RWS09950.1 hypothetical protein B4U79_14836 [Dinothrombium tinctorium]RWS14700.1 hypothetical protein B4U79_00525 [Dinothrombium tinctorium]
MFWFRNAKSTLFLPAVISRRYSSDFGFKCVRLSNKHLLSVRGKDTFSLLQGIVTNDIRHLYVNLDTSVHLNCIFAFMLRFNGRVFADLMMYTFNNQNNFAQNEASVVREGTDDDLVLIECDSSLSKQILDFINTHKLRKKVTIDFSNGYSVFSIYPNIDAINANLKFELTKQIRDRKLLLTKDPRLNLLGYRLLIQNGSDVNFISDIVKKSVSEATVDDYREYRYKLGVGEGIIDHPVENCFPLECNADYLHGVSFHKGCYVGQELTARIYHTGVIRKRLMPFEIDGTLKAESIKPNETIVSADNKRRVGKIRSLFKNFGLALLNVEEVAKCDFSVMCGDVKLKVLKPFWWPKVAQRSKIPCGRADHETNDTCSSMSN